MPACDERGFTLIETLIALFIMISAATLLYRGFASGLAATTTADRQQAALTVARSRLASLGPELPLEAARYKGNEAGLPWSLDVVAYAGVEPQETAPLLGFWATVTVRWQDRAGRRHDVRLTTLKLRDRHETASAAQ